MANITPKDIDKIVKALEPEEVRKEKDHYFLRLSNPEEQRALILEVYPNIPLGPEKGTLVVVYTNTSHLQLHACSGYVISDDLGEVTFVGEFGGKISGLVIEKGAACSLYANVKRELLSGDFTKLGVEVMLSSIALSLTEGILDE
ncbi:MAG: hypothetical protein AMJ92_05540 [candidate division Zixibacteria bacterium SM23_81]|nr:MAG: hypothetical protein AMJ92_05540 [candidate division Zixibacteria bacterium SM23_81]